MFKSKNIVMPIEAVFEDGVFKPLKKVRLPKTGEKVRIIIFLEFKEDLEEVFGILKEDVDLKKLRREWDRDVSY
jgi:predicted DNA-binding antitoxin AbrB/MazE fold protein